MLPVVGGLIGCKIQWHQQQLREQLCIVEQQYSIHYIGFLNAKGGRAGWLSRKVAHGELVITIADIRKYGQSCWYFFSFDWIKANSN